MKTSRIPVFKTSLKDSSIAGKIFFYRYFYLMLLPVVIWYFVFSYTPMYGITLAFKSFNYNEGIIGSPWIGFQNFLDMVKDPGFISAFKNTLIISFCKLLIHFPVPIILSILLNEMTRRRLKKVYQTIFTFPHFISWVVMSGIIISILSKDGIVNQIISVFGGDAVSPLVTSSQFRTVIYTTHIWKQMGWDSIIYLAALANINPELLEAASIDGAGRFQKIMHITWPCIRGTAAILLILQIGLMLNIGSGFDQIFNLYNSSVYDVADTIDTFIFRTTFTIGSDFGYMTAVGLVKSVINLLLLITANYTVRKLGEQGIF